MKKDFSIDRKLVTSLENMLSDNNELFDELYKIAEREKVNRDSLK